MPMNIRGTTGRIIALAALGAVGCTGTPGTDAGPDHVVRDDATDAATTDALAVDTVNDSAFDAPPLDTPAEDAFDAQSTDTSPVDAIDAPPADAPLADVHDAATDGGSAVIPRHFPTWAYLGGLGGQTDGTSATSTNATSTMHVRTWLDYGEGGGNPHEKAYLDCTSGCTPVMYFDAAKKYDNCSFDQMFEAAVATDESAWYHQAAPGTLANRIHQTNAPGCGGATSAYYPNGNDPGVQSYWQRWLRTMGFPPNTYGFADDTSNWCTMFESTTPSTIPVELGASSTCAATHARHIGALFAAMTFASGAPMPIVYNGINAPSAFQVQTDLSVLNLPTVRGAVGEGFVVGSLSGSTIFPRAISSVLDTLSLVNATADRLYVMLAYLRTSATGPCTVAANAWYQNCNELQQRRVALGTVWLGFEPGHEVLFEPTTVATQLQVWPEVSIYPTRPLQSMTPFTSGGTNGSGCGATPGHGGAADLVVQCGALSDGTPDGVYRREFAACYNFGTLVGPCAVVLNTTAAPVAVQSAWLRQHYAHSMVLHAGDVLAAGCGNGPCPTSALDPNGAAFTAGTTQVPPVDALFLF